MKKHTAQSLKILTCSVMVAALVMPYGNVQAALANSKFFEYKIEGKTQNQTVELYLPPDFKNIQSITTDTGNVLEYTVDKATKKLKVSVGNGANKREDVKYSGEKTDFRHAETGKFTEGYMMWERATTPDLYNVQVRLLRDGATDWTEWMTPEIYAGYYAWGYVLYDNAKLTAEFRGYTQRTEEIFYQYKININYYSNSQPVTTVSSPDNQRLSEVEGYNKLDITGTFKDSDIGDTLIGKYSIDGTSHNNKAFSSFTSNGKEQPFSHSITIDNSIPEGERTLRVWVEDNEGVKSSEVIRHFTVDKTKPTITLNNITENQTIVNAAIPSITVSDNSTYTKELFLNDLPYAEGTEINTSGKQELKINVVDAVGNAAAKTVNFTINKTPVIENPIANQVANKFDILTLDLKTLRTTL